MSTPALALLGLVMLIVAIPLAFSLAPFVIAVIALAIAARLTHLGLAEAAGELDVESAIIDGEVIVTNEAGLSDFRALRKAITDPGVAAKLREMAVTPGGTSSADFRKMIDADIENYVSVVKAANLKFD